MSVIELAKRLPLLLPSAAGIVILQWPSAFTASAESQQQPVPDFTKGNNIAKAVLPQFKGVSAQFTAVVSGTATPMLVDLKDFKWCSTFGRQTTSFPNIRHFTERQLQYLDACRRLFILHATPGALQPTITTIVDTAPVGVSR